MYSLGGGGSQKDRLGAMPGWDVSMGLLVLIWQQFSSDSNVDFYMGLSQYLTVGIYFSLFFFFFFLIFGYPEGMQKFWARGGTCATAVKTGVP